MKIAVITGLVLLVTAIFFTFGFHCYPIYRIDSSFFIPTAINLAAGKGFINDLYPLVDLFDKTGQDRFLSYPPLFPALLGRLMWQPTPQVAYILLAAFNSLSLILSAVGFYKIATLNNRQLSWFGTVIICLGLLGMATHFAGRSTGRPEVLTTLLLCLGMLWVLFCNHGKPVLHIGLGVILGAIGCTQGIGGAMTALIVALYFAIQQPFTRALKSIAWVYGIALTSFLAIMKLTSPYPIGEIIPAIIGHAKYSTIFGTLYGDVAQPFLKEFQEFHFTIQHMTFYGLMLFFAVFALGHLWYRHQDQIRCPKLLILSSLLLTVLVIKTSIISSFSSYNLYQLVPLLFGIVVFYSIHLLENTLKLPSAIKLLPVGILLLTTAGFFKSTLMFPFFIKYGMQLPEARAAYQQLENEVNTKIGVTPAMWVLTENYQRLFLVRGFYRDDQFSDSTLKNRNIIILQQKYTGGFPPLQPDKETIHHRLYKNYFSPVKPQILGKQISKNIEGYQFAVYVPKHSPWKKTLPDSPLPALNSKKL